MYYRGSAAAVIVYDITKQVRLSACLLPMVSALLGPRFDVKPTASAVASVGLRFAAPPEVIWSDPPAQQGHPELVEMNFTAKKQQLAALSSGQKFCRLHVTDLKPIIFKLAYNLVFALKD